MEKETGARRRRVVLAIEGVAWEFRLGGEGKAARRGKVVMTVEALERSLTLTLTWGQSCAVMSSSPTQRSLTVTLSMLAFGVNIVLPHSL